MSLRSMLGRLLSFGWMRSRAARTAAWEAHFRAGMIAHREGRAGVAETEYEAALGEAEGFAADDPRLAVSLTTLVGVYRFNGKNALAEPLCLRALALKEKTLGADHPEVAATLKDLVEILRAQGKAREAEPHYRRALAVLEKAVGPDFSDLAESLERSPLLKDDRDRPSE